MFQDLRGGHSGIHPSCIEYLDVRHCVGYGFLSGPEAGLSASNICGKTSQSIRSSTFMLAQTVLSNFPHAHYSSYHVLFYFTLPSSSPIPSPWKPNLGQRCFV